MNRTFRPLTIAFGVAISIVTTSSTSWAGLGRERNAANMQEGSIGVGAEVGCGTGATAKFRFAEAHSVQGTLGLGRVACDEDLFLSADYLFELPNFVTNPRQVQFGWYVGIGGRYAIAYDVDYHYRGRYYYNRTNVDLGPRVPIGFEVYLTKVRPLELFIEAAPGVDLIDPRDSGLTIDIASGARWFF